MAYSYAVPPTQAALTPTYGSKTVLCKSFKVDIAGGSPFLTATTYTLGTLPKSAQVVSATMAVSTAVAGGTVSAATVVVQSGGYTLFNGSNVFATSVFTLSSVNYYANLSTVVSAGDQTVTIAPTLTGAGATAGVIYINVFYVV